MEPFLGRGRPKVSLDACPTRPEKDRLKNFTALLDRYFEDIVLRLEDIDHSSTTVNVDNSSTSISEASAGFFLPFEIYPRTGAGISLI